LFGGTCSPVPAGIEEFSTILLHQTMSNNNNNNSKAKLVSVPGIEWEQSFVDEERKKWHELKMKSKYSRAEIHRNVLGIEHKRGSVIHISTSGTAKSSNMMKNKNEDKKYLIKVSEVIPTLEECMTFVTDPSCGAISTFSGITRNNFQGKTVTKLSYEGYIPMAERELRKICIEANDKYPSVQKIAAVHIIGDCPVSKASVLLCASSPHRKDAIYCVEYLIDELKARVPIWKLECYEDGDGESVWKENVEWFNGKQHRVMVKVDKK